MDGWKFMIHKRSGSSGAKDFSSAQQKAAEQSNLCINGSHVYYDEPQNRTSRIGSNFSLASSGHGSMEDVPDSSPPSVDSLRTTRQYSPWTEEEISESLKEGEEEEETQIEEEKVYVEEGVEKENARKKEEKILKEEEMRQEEEKRRLEEKQRWHEEKVRKEEEMIRMEEERKKEQRLEEEKRWEEEKTRENEERRKDMERKRLEEEEEKRLEEERRRLEEEKERRRLEEEERRRLEEEEEERRLEQKARKEEEKRKEMERVEEEVRKEERRMEEEKRKQEEKRNIEERFKEEMERHEQEKRRQDLDKEKEEKARRDMEGYARMVKEMKKQEEEEREQMIIEQRKEKEDQRIWKEEEDRARKEREEEERSLAENKEEVEKKAENFPSEEQMKNVTQIKSDVIASLNPFDENYRPPAGTRTSPPAGSRTSPPAGSRTSPPAGSRTSPPAGSRTSPPAASLLRPRTSSSDDKDQGGSQREKRPAPQPPGKHQAPRGPQGSPPRADRWSTDIGTVPQKSFQATSPVGRSDPQNTSMHSSSMKVTLTGAKQGKGPAPSRPCPGARAPPTSNISHTSSLDVKQAPISYGLNPFEDDEDEDEANFDPTRWPPAAASSSKFKSSKKARAPPLPELCDTPSTSVGLNPGGDPDPAVVVPDNHQVLPCDPGSISEAKPVTPQGSGGKREEPPTTKRRLLPVKPLNPLRQAVNQGGKDIQAFGILSDDLKNTKGDLELKGPYSQLTKAELISLVLKQDNQLLEKDKKVSELEQYIDNLLVRVMEEQPSILMSMNTLKKSV